MATGVLVVAVGQATKLALYLTPQDKRYAATVAFGTRRPRSTRGFEVTGDRRDPGASWRRSSPGPRAARPTRGHSSGACARQASNRAQSRCRPRSRPSSRTGARLQARASRRRGRCSRRAVEVRDLGDRRDCGRSLDLQLVVSKGYYVRSLARDLGETLGVPAHLRRLRRTASGLSRSNEALATLDAPVEDLRRALQPVPRVAAPGAPGRRARRRTGARGGAAMLGSHRTSSSPPTGPGSRPGSAPEGELVAIGARRERGGFAVERGFSQLRPRAPPPEDRGRRAAWRFALAIRLRRRPEAARETRSPRLIGANGEGRPCERAAPTRGAPSAVGIARPGDATNQRAAHVRATPARRSRNVSAGDRAGDLSCRSSAALREERARHGVEQVDRHRRSLARRSEAWACRRRLLRCLPAELEPCRRRSPARRPDDCARKLGCRSSGRRWRCDCPGPFGRDEHRRAADRALPGAGPECWLAERPCAGVAPDSRSAR